MLFSVLSAYLFSRAGALGRLHGCMQDISRCCEDLERATAMLRSDKLGTDGLKGPNYHPNALCNPYITCTYIIYMPRERSPTFQLPEQLQ